MGTSGQMNQKPLLEWALRLCPESPKKRVKEWIASGRFYLAGQAVTQANLMMPDPGEALTFGKPDPSLASWAHRKRVHARLSVLFLDDSLAIVDKEAGLLAVPVEGQSTLSALQILGDYLNDPRGEDSRRRLFGSPSRVQPLPVHRLDQYTSGLMCIGLNPEARSALIEQLRGGELLREYIAFVDGRARSESGTWRHYLKLDRDEYRQSLHHQPVEGSVEAVTHFSVEKVFERQGVSLLRLRLETGLKHQIRIQAAAEGLPLIGDRVYHPGTVKALERKGALPFGFRRQALHAASIGLRHPVSGQMLRFDSNLPKDLKGLRERLA